MIVDDEFVEEDFQEGHEDDLMNPALSAVYDCYMDAQGQPILSNQ
jgi:hypothetical protein